MKCQRCGARAVGWWLWADGRAIAPACAGHKAAVGASLKERNGKFACIVGWRAARVDSDAVGKWQKLRGRRGNAG